MSFVTKPITRVFEKFFGHPKSASLPVVVDAGGAVTPAGAPGATVPVADVIRPTKFNPATDGATSGRRKKRKPWNIARVSALFLVVVPSVASAVYFGFFASNQYSAKFQFAVRSNDRTIMPDVGIALPGMGNSSPVASDSYIAVEYLKSRQLIEDISKRIDLRSMYQSESIDWLSRLKPTAPIEDVVDYWQKQVDVRYEALSGIVFASVRAFSPENSLEVAKHALQLSEILVNELSRKARDEALTAAESDVKRAELRLAAALAMLKKFRDRTGVLDPAKGAEAGLQVFGRLQEELVRLRTQLSILEKNMSPNALPIQNLRQRIAAIEEQVKLSRLDIGKSGSESRTPELSSQLLSEYESLELERQFSEKSYTVALASLEKARSDAVRNQRYLSIFVEPHMPQDPSHPRRALMIFTVAVFSAIGWAVFMLVFMTVKEHVT